VYFFFDGLTHAFDILPYGAHFVRPEIEDESVTRCNIRVHHGGMLVLLPWVKTKHNIIIAGNENVKMVSAMKTTDQWRRPNLPSSPGLVIVRITLFQSSIPERIA
jgi:hypothetical protein